METMENVDPVVPESVVASVETTENEKNAEEFGRETLAETSVPQGAANSAEHEMVTSGTDKVPGERLRCRKAVCRQRPQAVRQKR